MAEAARSGEVSYTQYWTNQNGILRGRYNSLGEAKQRAESLAKQTLEWKLLDDEGGYYAFTKGDAVARDEWSVAVMVKCKEPA
jgi:hypothetical protein